MAESGKKMRNLGLSPTHLTPNGAAQAPAIPAPCPSALPTPSRFSLFSPHQSEKKVAESTIKSCLVQRRLRALGPPEVAKLPGLGSSSSLRPP